MAENNKVLSLNANNDETSVEKTSLGDRIRQLRQERNWSLAELSKRSGIATSTLSKVENNSLSLTYDRLYAVADAFEMTLPSFIAGPPSRERTGPTGRYALAKLGSGEIYDTENYASHYLCTSLTRKHMVPCLTTIKARSLEEFGELKVHEGEEFAFVVKGRIEIHTEFYTPQALGEGEAVYFDGGMGHAYINAGEGEAIVLVVNHTP